MKKYLKEIIILFIQLFMFYIFPLFAGPSDIMGMIVIIIFATFFLSFILGIISNNKIKYLYPVLISIMFIPTVFIYYNETALIHALWYLAVSFVSLFIGAGIKTIFNKKLKNKKEI